MPLSSRFPLFSLLTIALAAGSAVAGDLLNFPMSYQEQDNWCWAAADKMVRDFLSPNSPSVRQCSDASVANQNNVCGVPAACCDANYYACNLGCTSQIRNAYSATVVSQTLNWPDVTAEIDHGRPFIFLWNWDTGGSHIMVGKGYAYSTKAWVTANDPMRGAVAYPHSQFLTHTGIVWSNI